MSPLEQLRAEQHNDQPTAADAALEAFLAECSLHDAHRDLLPTTDIELRHLNRARRNAA